MAISANEFNQQIDDIAKKLDDLMIQVGERSGRSLSREMGVSKTAIELAVKACSAHELLANAVGKTGGAVRAEVDDLDAWLDVERRLGTLLLRVREANRVRRHRVGKMTWQVYHILKQLRRGPEFAHLANTLESMQHELGRRTRRKAAAAPAEG